jgi:hypothetical protein
LNKKNPVACIGAKQYEGDKTAGRGAKARLLAGVMGEFR